MSKLLEARKIVKEYTQKKTSLRVLNGISVSIERGEFVVIAGSSGAGKSTLLHILGLLDRPTSGEVFLEGENLGALSRTRQARIRNRRFGFVFQFFHLLRDFNALENVAMPSLTGISALGWLGQRQRVKARAAELLDQMGLGERAHHRPYELSGGERQRVAIARALMNEPDILFLDEPTGNLDSRTGARIHELIRKLNEDTGQTVVMVTHEDALARRGGRVIRIMDGAVERV